MKEKIKKITILIIVVAIAINFINYISFYYEINPFYSVWSFLGIMGSGIMGSGAIYL